MLLLYSFCPPLSPQKSSFEKSRRRAKLSDRLYLPAFFLFMSVFTQPFFALMFVHLFSALFFLSTHNAP